MSMHNDMEEILITEDALQQRIRELGAVLTEEYRDKNPIIIGVLKGVVLFYADMVRQIQVPCEMEFLRISSYSGTQNDGGIKEHQGLARSIEGRHVLVLEDIFDTGHSLDFTYNYLMGEKPASLKICTLLDKPERRDPKVTLKADYVGFTVPNAFVVGYGLDFDEKYRNLPYIGVLKPEFYSKKEQ